MPIFLWSSVSSELGFFLIVFFFLLFFHLINFLHSLSCFFSSFLIRSGTIFVDDGLISLHVTEIVNDLTIKAKVVNSGKLGSRKGVNLPNVNVDLPALSEKDRADLAFGVENQIDMVFASFIRKAADVMEVRKALGEKGGLLKIT
jgi:pyruvate kinase